MTAKKDYEAIARAIKLATDLGEKHMVNKDQLLSELCVYLKKDNEKFDGYRFIEACK